jgi:hypothetical protein
MHLVSGVDITQEILINMPIIKVTDTFIKVNDLPNYVDVDYNKEFGLPTEEQLAIATSKSGDNWTPETRDPLNWYIFDPGNDVNPRWVTNVEYDPVPVSGMGSFDLPLDNAGKTGTLQPIPCGGTFNDRYSFGTNFIFYGNGGPRNKGYTKINEGTWIKHNAGIGDQFTGGPGSGGFGNPFTQIWRSGSLEFTIKPEKSNCTITSGSLFPQQNTANATVDAAIAGDGPTLKTLEIPIKGINDPIGAPDPDVFKYVTDVEFPNYSRYGSEKLIWAEYDRYDPNYDQGLILQNLQHTFRTFSVKLLDGKLNITYITT